MIRALIIDPDIERKESFQKSLITNFDSVAKVYSFIDKKKGIQALESERIDVLFIYIERNSQDTYEWLGHIDRESVEVIFLTEDPRIAFEALRLRVTDVLLLPFNEEELQSCIHQLENTIRKKRELAVILHSVNVNRLKQNESMFIKTTRSYIHIWMHTMTRLEADGNYTFIHLNDKKKILTSNHLKKYEQVLEQHDFYRVNKSFLINLHYVRFYHKGKSPLIEMEDGFSTEVSRKEKKDLRYRMETIASHTF